MNETLYDLEQKRKAVELDIQALYETLKKETKEIEQQILLLNDCSYNDFMI